MLDVDRCLLDDCWRWRSGNELPQRNWRGGGNDVLHMDSSSWRRSDQGLAHGWHGRM